MRDSYHPLRRAGSVRSRPSGRSDRLLVLTIAGAILLLQGASLGRIDEVAQAEPLAAARTGDVRLIDPADRPKVVATTTVTTVTPALLASPREVISCSQPPVGTFGSGGSDAGCMRRTLGDVPADEPKAVLAPSVSASADPAPVATPSRPMFPPFVATMPEPQPASAEPEPVQERNSPTVTAALSDPVEAARPRPAVREAVTPANAAVRLAALDKILVGRWVPRTEVCSRRGRSDECLPLSLGKTSARAGSASCRFSEMTREGPRWKLLASCRSDGERWTAHVRLSLAGKRLTWTSERGTQDYTR